MTVRFMEADFSSRDFAANIATLAGIAGHDAQKTPLIAAKLCRDGEPDFLVRRQSGKYVSCQLIHTLADGMMERRIVDDSYKKAVDFFEPLFGKEGHPIVEYMWKGPFYVKLLVLDEHVQAIEEDFDLCSEITPDRPRGKATVDRALEAMDLGLVRVAEPDEDGNWIVNEWAKKAVLLSFLQNGMEPIVGVPGRGAWFDKVPSKFEGWGSDEWSGANFRAVPGCVVRRSAYVAPNAVLMPSFVNLGAYVGEGTMIDTWATVGSCAQIGKNCHISGGAGIGGVLEPLQANPVIIEDDCFIGARSEVVEGVIIHEGAVLSMGVFIGKNTPIVDRVMNNTVYRGSVPPRAVVMMGVHPENGLICPQIVKYRDKGTDAATALNEMLRD